MKYLLQVFLLGSLVVIFYFWWIGSGRFIGSSTADTLIIFGRLFGLLAVYFILMQFVLIGRSPLLEPYVGLDKLARLHKTNGKIAFSFIFLHPLFIILGYSMHSQISLIDQIKDLFINYPYANLAMIAFLIFCTTVGTSLYIVRNRLKYETWYFIHLLTYLAVSLAFFHQITLGADFSNKSFPVFWYLLYTLILGQFILFRFFRPIFNFFRFGFRVEKVVKENYNTTSIFITGKNLQSFKRLAGQFMIVRFLNKDLWWQAHPFSLSISPEDTYIRLTIKSVGDYTSLIPNIKPGTKVIIDGPYGVFTKKSVRKEKLLFIAGGVGITPVRSLIEEVAKEGKNCILIFGNKTQNDFIFKRELDELSKKYQFKYVDVLSDDPNFKGEKGRIDLEEIKKLDPDYIERDIFLCGPPPMMESIKAGLKSAGVPDKDIHYERFAL